nr:hypothetical protein [uncultured Roseovarius sp.]
MKNLIASLFSLFLVASLALYGPTGMSKTGSDGDVFSMELCADGVSKPVLIGADGNPVEPAHDCAECLMCCSTVPAHLNVGCDTVALLAMVEVAPGRPTFHHPVFNTRNILPAPRGPPIMHHFVPGSFDLAGHGRALTGHEKRSDGRPFPKDADA